MTIAFTATIPGLLLTMVGSSLLGIALLRRGFRPRATAWLLTLTLPLLFVISEVTSLGNVILPVAFAFGIVGRRLGRASEPVGDDRVEHVDGRTPRVGAHLHP
jgi:hypothetical protein